ncbi:MAG TPA: diguanylate cyclase [Thermoanaerobaculia bacterium]|nr:diguanylate cyclase [Thermoanaerobaculia bacterium]
MTVADIQPHLKRMPPPWNSGVPDVQNAVLDQIGEGVCLVDLDRRITFWNRAAERLTGWTRSEAVGSVCSEDFVLHCSADGEVLSEVECPLAAALEDGEARETEMHLLHRGGSRLSVHLRSSPMYDEAGFIIGSVQIFSDNTVKLALFDQVERMKHDLNRDALTGVGNRRFFEREIGAMCNDMVVVGWPYSIVFVDIDHFKAVNDRYGHDAGDRVLRAVAQMLGSVLRPLDVLARWGGEEFVIVAPDLAGKSLRTFAERLRMLFASRDIPAGRERIAVTASIGGTAARPREQWAATLARADRLMYESKTGGRNRVTIA